MLPGFRFLLAAIVLCISIVVFGLGAAALLRAAHEEFAQNPAWRATPEPRLAQSEETRRPMLAMLRVEPAATGLKSEPRTLVDVPANPMPLELRPATSEAPVSTPSAADEEKLAAPPAQAISTPIEIAKVETTPEQASTAAEKTPASAAPAMDTPAAPDSKVAVEQASTAASEKPAEPTATPALTTPEPEPAPATRTAKLDDRPLLIEPDAEVEREAVAELDQEDAKKRLRAQRAKERRRLAARRARLAQQQAAAPQTPFDPFGQQTPMMQQTVATQQTAATQPTVATRRSR
jgi:hypothetical protein